ncbi:hypothetical protein BGZ76_000280 [Entomortierella beljakovae]|nr:hypothetical protein BGZ76_000280 [Entomortierella beljakovae]
METHHVLNPWQQRQYKQDILVPDPPDTFPLTDAETRSYDDFFHDHKLIIHQSKLVLQQLQQQQQQQQQQQREEQLEQSNLDLESNTEGDDDGETDSQTTAWSQIGIDSPLNYSSSTLADSTTVLYMTDSGKELEGDVLESLVHTLQSEVEDSKATVHDLEDRLNLRARDVARRPRSEEISYHAEATLRKGKSNLTSKGKGTSSVEDSNIVYNRICVALQALIDEAQLSLQRNSAKSTVDHGPDIQPISNKAPHSPEPGISLPKPTDFELDNNIIWHKHEQDLQTLLDPAKIRDDRESYQLDYSPPSFYSSTDEVSRIYWKQKHEEQHDRYRKSCQRLTLELEGRFQGLSTDSEDSDASFNFKQHTVPKSLSVRLTPNYASSTASTPNPSTPSTPSTPTTPSQPLQGILRSSKKDGSRKDRIKKKYQVQFLNPDIESTSRQTSLSSTTMHRQEHQQQQQQLQRQFTSRSVGSNRSRGVVLQLYDLWQQTWLRTRIMHVITGSVEIVIIIWVVIKASRLTLTWFGVQPSTVNQWVTFIYGQRDGAGIGAKEIYAKIRKDGFQMRQIKAWGRKESADIVEDLVGAAASTSLISPSSIVYGPAKRVVANAATGIALAFLSDGARRLARKF